jgi:hypothetical protein
MRLVLPLSEGERLLRFSLLKDLNSDTRISNYFIATWILIN